MAAAGFGGDRHPARPRRAPDEPHAVPYPARLARLAVGADVPRPDVHAAGGPDPARAGEVVVGHIPRRRGQDVDASTGDARFRHPPASDAEVGGDVGRCAVAHAGTQQRKRPGDVGTRHRRTVHRTLGVRAAPPWSHDPDPGREPVGHRGDVREQGRHIVVVGRRHGEDRREAGGERDRVERPAVPRGGDDRHAGRLQLGREMLGRRTGGETRRDAGEGTKADAQVDRGDGLPGPL